MMRLETQGPDIHVFLSRRNLVTLFAKLDGAPKESARTMVYDTRDGLRLHITAEEDAPHYSNPERDFGQGPMHPETEADLELSERNIRAMAEGRSPELTDEQITEARTPIP